MQAHTNETAQIVWVYGKALMPGQTRIFDSPAAPPDAPLPAVPSHPPAFYSTGEPEDNPLVGFLDRPVAEIRTELSQFDLNDLAELKATEISGQNRKTLLASIDEEIEAQAHAH